MIESGPTDPTDPTEPVPGTSAEGADDMARTAAHDPAGLHQDRPADTGGTTRLVEGTRVEVRNRLDGTWSRGFEVEDTTAGGYRLRRLSDRTVLPAVFGDDDVRPERERRRGTWWY